MKDKAGIGFLNIEFITIMRDNYIRVSIKLPESFNEFLIVLPVMLKATVVREGGRVNLVFPIPLIRKAENIPASLDID